MKKVIPIILIFTLLFPLFQTHASVAVTSSFKEEVIYGILSSEGKVNNLYAVNILRGNNILDYGSYSEISNMTTSDKMTYTGDKITSTTNVDKFYYQGTIINKELPWVFDIKYQLNNKEIPAKELAGKSGNILIKASVKQNKSIDSFFFNNFALQITMLLDGKLCTNIETNNATITEAAGKKHVSFTILPGKEAEISVSFNAKDFKMDPITINGIRLLIDLELNTEQFIHQIKVLTDAIKGLDDGSTNLLSGLNQVSDGMQRYIKGINDFNNYISLLANSADKINNGATSLNDGLSELTNINDSLVSGANNIMHETFNTINAKLLDSGLDLPTLTPENYSTILSPIPELAQMKAQLESVIKFVECVKAYTTGVAELKDGAVDLSQGTKELSKATNQMALSSNTIYNAGKEINTAISVLREGLLAYNKGINELSNKTKDMDIQISKQIDELLNNISGSEGDAISFTSSKNTNVSNVQFVIKTEDIKETEDTKVVYTKPLKLTFWQRLLRLFGIKT